MQLKVKKLDKEAQLPTKAHPEEDAGFDLYSISEAVTWPSTGETYEVKTGIAIEIPQGYYGQIMTRSSFGKKGLRVHPGVIDSGYRGEITILVFNLSQYQYTVKKGDKVAQLLILPVPMCNVEEVKELSVSSRGAGSFGSTGI